MTASSPRFPAVVLRLVLAGLVLAVLVPVSGCGGSRPFVTRTSYVEFTPEQKLTIANTRSDEYRIQEGDILKIAFAYEKSLNQDGIVVLTDGSVNLVGVDRIKVAGLTMTQADSLITTAYAKDYRDPELSVMIQETQGLKVYVLGEVRTPGIHNIPRGGLTVLGAIAKAGGFSEDAAKDGVVLIHVTPDGYSLQEINLDDLSLESGGALAMVELQPLDVLYVPSSRIGDFHYFSRAVLSGLVSITRIASDLKYISGGSIGGRF